MWFIIESVFKSRAGYDGAHKVYHNDLSNLKSSYTANFYTMKTTRTGNCGVPAGKTCDIYVKGL